VCSHRELLTKCAAVPLCKPAHHCPLFVNIMFASEHLCRQRAGVPHVLGLQGCRITCPQQTVLKMPDAVMHMQIRGFVYLQVSLFQYCTVTRHMTLMAVKGESTSSVQHAVVPLWCCLERCIVCSAFAASRSQLKRRNSWHGTLCRSSTTCGGCRLGEG
jgi:hypothetical protein